MAKKWVVQVDDRRTTFTTDRDALAAYWKAMRGNQNKVVRIYSVESAKDLDPVARDDQRLAQGKLASMANLAYAEAQRQLATADVPSGLNSNFYIKQAAASIVAATLIELNR